MTKIMISVDSWASFQKLLLLFPRGWLSRKVCDRLIHHTCLTNMECVQHIAHDLTIFFHACCLTNRPRFANSHTIRFSYHALCEQLTQFHPLVCDWRDLI